MRILIEQWRLTVWLVGLPLLLGVIGHFLIYGLIRKITRRSKNVVDDSLVEHCYRPFQWTIVVFVMRLALPTVFPDEIPSSLSHILSLLLIGIVSWLLIKVVYVFEDFLVSKTYYRCMFSIFDTYSRFYRRHIQLLKSAHESNPMTKFKLCQVFRNL